MTVDRAWRTCSAGSACSRSGSGTSSPPDAPATRRPTTRSAASTSATTPSTSCSQGPRRPVALAGDVASGSRPARPRRTPPRTPGRRCGCGTCARRSGWTRSTSTSSSSAIAADVDPRFEAFFGYLNDDVSRRRPSVAVALELAGVPLASAGGHAHLLHGPLIAGWPGRARRAGPSVPRAGAAGARPRRRRTSSASTRPTPTLAPVLGDGPRRAVGRPVAARAGAGARRDPRLPPRAGHRVRSGARGRGAPAHRARPLVIDLDRLVRQPDADRLARLAAREARLSGCGIVAGPVSAVKERPELLQCAGGGPAPAAARRRRVLGPGLDAAAAADRAGARPAPTRSARRCGGSRWPGTVDRARRVRRDGAVPAAAGRGRARGGVRPGAGAGRSADGRITARPPAGRRPLRERLGPRAAGAPGRARGRLGRPGAAARRADGAAGAGAAGPAPRAGARRLADAPGRRPRPRRGRAVRRRLRHRQDHVGRGDRRTTSGSTCTSSTSPPSSTSTSARPRRTSSGSSPAAAGVNAVLLFDEADAVFGKRLGGARRPRPLRQRRDRLPAPADGVVRRAGHPRHQPARQHRRGVHPAARRDGRLPDARRPSPARAVGPLPRDDGTALAGRRPALPAPTPSSWPAGRSAPPRSPPPTSPPPTPASIGMRHLVGGRAPGVPQARPALPGVGVRARTGR